MENEIIKNSIKNIIILINFIFISLITTANSEPIFHDKYYPNGGGPFPVVIALHTSSGYKTVKKAVKGFIKSGYAVYTPDFFKRHGLSHKNRFQTWTKYRLTIEKELIELLEVAKTDPKVNPKNLFAVGYSNGGYWASFLAAKNYVNASASHYGVWSWPRTHNGYPARYFSKDSNPLLALHGNKETVQKIKYVWPQIQKASSKSLRLKYHIFNDAGHSWDCKSCKKDGYNANVTKRSLDMTLKFFKENTIN